MPRINRIRIVNFSYNNDTRHIVDECFDFHGGADALLNLSNGGGKSVLVQLFLQVVVPGARIQGRNIAGFFRKNKLPAYVMIEWKLDGAGGGYLLTGICLAAAETAESEGARPRVRYFTFTSKYTGANTFDIKDIPLMERNGSVLEIKPFREARKILSDKSRSNPYLVGYFPEDEAAAYARRLAEFGISQDEWRTVITRINDSENGLEDLFQKYKSSSQLLDDWIIKTVEKVMFKGRAEQKQLEEMLQSLVQEVVENERFIIERQLFSGFLGRFNEILADLVILLKNLEEQKRLGASLAALYIYLGSAINAQQEAQRFNQQAIDAARIEEQRVALEERSHQYHLRAGEHQAALQMLGEAEQSTTHMENELGQAKVREKIQQAARLWEEMLQMISELSGIEEKLAMAREGYDRDKRANSLEYTLKIGYEERLEALATDLAALRAAQADLQQRLSQVKDERRTVEMHKGHLDADKGRLEERLKAFIAQEQQAQKYLGRQWIRNLLGELDAAEMNGIQNDLINAKDQILAEQQNVLAEVASLKHRLQSIDLERHEIQEARADNLRTLSKHEGELAAYLQKEQTTVEILGRYGYDSSLLFDRERLTLTFTRYMQDLEQKSESALQSRNEIMEAQSSIKYGHLHTSRELALTLAELDIQYDTGEKYLSNQPSHIRQTMLMANPILPYAFIMSRADIDRLARADLNSIMRRVGPLIAYEDLNQMIENQGRIVCPPGGVALVCFYEGRIFDHENLQQLIQEMEARRVDAAERCDHFAGAHRSAVLDLAACQSFDYDRDFRYELEKTIGTGQKRREDLARQLDTLEQTKKQIIERQERLEHHARSLAGHLPQAEAALDVFQEFRGKEPEYQHCRAGLDQIKQELSGLEKKRERLDQSLEKLQADVSQAKSQITERARLRQETEKHYDLFKTAPPADRVAGSIEELEKRLIAIKGEYTQEIGHLQQRQQDVQARCAQIRKQLDKLGLCEDDYALTGFDEAVAETVHGEIIQLEAVLKIKRGEQLDAARAEAGAAMALSNALDEVKKLRAQEPLAPQEIKGDFAGRRDRLHIRIRELETANKQIFQTLSRYDRIRENIQQAVDMASIEADQTFIPEPDITVQASRWEQEYRDIHNDNRKNVEKLKTRYSDCKVEYREKNLNLDNIFKGLDPLWYKAQTEFEDFYYLFERMTQHGEKLAELIAVYETQLANLERNKKDMVQQSFLQGRRMYEEIESISEHSKVRLQGKPRPVQMLKIELRFDDQDAARQRVSDYVEECVARVREKTRQENREDDLRKTIARLMSNRELLNIYLGTAHIPVYVFKIDMNMQNSKLKIWEEAVRENSGAEKFVVFFSVLAALMTYTRARGMEALGADPDTDTRVIIMDNPFGPISSEHLLKPMFEIARKHRTQMICLSDLKQNTILNRFNLIYMLKVRPAAVGGTEYLKIDQKVVRDQDALANDERLEKAIYHTSELIEVPLFGDDQQ